MTSDYRRGGYISGPGEMTIPAAPAGPGPGATFPGPSDLYDWRTYPVRRMGAHRVLDKVEARLDDGGALYALRSAIGYAKLDLLQAMLREDVVRLAGRDRVTIEIRG